MGKDSNLHLVLALLVACTPLGRTEYCSYLQKPTHCKKMTNAVVTFLTFL